MRKKDIIKGIYVSPGAIIRDPEYTKSLVFDHGINLLVIRCGFDPASWDASIGGAVDIASKLGVEYYFLAGTWWGHSEKPQVEEMKPAVDIVKFPPTQSFEAQFPMKGLGASSDALIAESIEGLCRSFKPGGICLTHARFRSSAYLPGLFEYSDGRLKEEMEKRGVPPIKMKKAFISMTETLSKLAESDLSVLSQESNFPGFLDRLTEDNVFSTWFELRESVLIESIQTLRRSIKALDSGNILFGSNLYDPFGASLCGQTYDRLNGLYDFVQPLLSYMLWHIYEPVSAWSKFLLNYAPRLKMADAVEVSSRLFGLNGLGLPLDPDTMIQQGEGPEDVILNVINKGIHFCKTLQNRKFIVTPVLRGRDWPKDVSLSLSETVINEGFGGVIFQGTQAISDSLPGDGWY